MQKRGVLLVNFGFPHNVDKNSLCGMIAMCYLCTIPTNHNEKSRFTAAPMGRGSFFHSQKKPGSGGTLRAFKNQFLMTAKIGLSEQIRQRQAKINEQCKNGSAAPAPKPQQAAPAAPDDPSKFPFDVLPLRAQEFITGAKIANGVPNEYLAACMLFTAATSQQRRHS